MAHKWNYSRAPGCRVGLMICNACHNPIENCDFRYRETEDAFLPQHRKCSADDPQWQVIDAEEKQQADKEARRIVAWDAFVAEFGIPDDLYHNSDRVR